MPEALTLYPLAELLRLPPSWLRALALAGRIPHLRVGSRLLFSVATVQAALARIADEGDKVQLGLEAPARAAASVRGLSTGCRGLSMSNTTPLTFEPDP